MKRSGKFDQCVFANNEKILKENSDTQHKLCEELERERMNER